MVLSKNIKLMRKILAVSILMCALFIPRALAQSFTGMDTNLSNLYKLSDAKSRSISPENFTGQKGKGGMAELGEGAASHEARGTRPGMES